MTQVLTILLAHFDVISFNVIMLAVAKEYVTAGINMRWECNIYIICGWDGNSFENIHFFYRSAMVKAFI